MGEIVQGMGFGTSPPAYCETTASTFTFLVYLYTVLSVANFIFQHYYLHCYGNPRKPKKQSIPTLSGGSRLTLFLFAIGMAFTFFFGFSMLPWWINFTVYLAAFAIALYCVRDVPPEWRAFISKYLFVGGCFYWIVFLPATIYQYDKQHEIDITFKTSASPYRKFITRHDLSEFKDYLEAMKIIPPEEGPVIGIDKQGRCSAFVNPQSQLGVRSQELWIGEQCLTRESMTLQYATFVIRRLPQTKRLDNSPNHFVALMDGQMAFISYLNWSFWGRDLGAFCPGTLGIMGTPTLWKIRRRLGRNFTDDMVAYAVRLMMDDPLEGMDDDHNIYMARKLKQSDWVIDDGANWPIILGILKEDGVKVEGI